MGFWIDQRINVLFRRRRGTGLDSLVKLAFDHAGLKWRFFSASMVSVEQILADKSVDAMFFDEIDRMPKIVCQAVMDLLQFKSIKGEHFLNLKVVWAAINLGDDEGFAYEAESLNPAQANHHFEITIDVPNRQH